MAATSSPSAPDRWRVIIGEGHSPEHVSLYCAERKILIAGDQILPSITTNVSTWHVEPEFDAVGAFLKTCKTFLDVLHPDTLDPAVAPQAVPQRAAPAARSSPCITPSAST